MGHSGHGCRELQAKVVKLPQPANTHATFHSLTPVTWIVQGSAGQVNFSRERSVSSRSKSIPNETEL